MTNKFEQNNHNQDDENELEIVEINDKESRQISYQIKAIENQIKILRKASVNIETHSKELNNIACMLNDLPTRTEALLEEKIRSIAPVVSQDIQKCLTIDLKASLQKCYDVTLMVMEKTEDVLKKDMTKFLKTLGLSVLLSTGAAMSSSYFMMTKFPQKVYVDTKGNINVNSSELIVTGQSSLNVNNSKTKVLPIPSLSK